MSAIDDDAPPSLLGFALGLRLTREEDRAGSVRNQRGARELLDQALEPFLERCAFARGGGVDRQEELSEIRRALGRKESHDVGAERRVRQDPAEELDDESQTVSLVARVRLLSAQGLERSGEGRLGRGGRFSVRADRPTHREILPSPGGDLDAPAGNRARGHVEHEHPEASGRRRHGNGVGPEERDPCPGRCDQGRRVGQTHSDHPSLRGAHRVPAGDAVVVRVPDGGDRGAGFRRARDRVVRRDPRRVVPPAVPRVETDEPGASGLANGPRSRVHDSRLHELDVLRQPRGAMRGDPAVVGGEEDLGDVRGDVGRRAHPGNDLRRPAAQRLAVDANAVGRIRVDGDGRLLLLPRETSRLKVSGER